MLMIPIAYRDKIYNIKLELAHTYMDPSTIYEKSHESDILVNGMSYNESAYYVKDAPLNNVIKFIRERSFYENTSCVLTSRRNEECKQYVFHFAPPLPKVTDGLDALYSSAILDKKKDIPGHSKGRDISLKKLKVTEHITEEKLKVLRRVVDSLGYLTLDNILEVRDERVLQLYQTLIFLKQFDCSVLDEATIDLKEMQHIVQSVDSLPTKSAREIKNYYQIAKENGNEYTKLEHLANTMTGESLGWVPKENNFTKTKGWADRYGL